MAIGGLVGIINGFRGLLRLAVSDDPQFVRERGEMAARYKQTVEQPFMDGYNGVPSTPKPPLIRKPFKIMLVIIFIALIIGMVNSTLFHGGW